MIIAVCFLIAAILFFDQLLKFLILKYLTLTKSYDIVKGIFSITPTFNTGGGFGILPNQTIIFIVTSIITIIFIAYLLISRKIKEKVFIYSISLILAGALGNLIDRIRFGAVVDFLDFKIWPVFNIADTSISIGVVLLAWIALFKPKRS